MAVSQNNHQRNDIPDPLGSAPPVLVVEDNELNMRLFTDILENFGYPVVGCVDAEKALDFLKDNTPGLIIMDIQLPGMSGVDCTKTIKASPRLKSVPVVAVTAFALDGDEARFRAAGCDDYMPKPINVAAFHEMVARHYMSVAQSA